MTEPPKNKEEKVSGGQGTENPTDQGTEKPYIRKKKRHNSALAAAAEGGSVVSAANARSSGDVGFGTTGTNLTYKEDGGSL